MKNTFGKLIRDLRIESNIGLRELSRLVGKSPGYISDVEQNKAPPPSEAVIVKIAEVLNTDRDKLLNLALKVDPELSNYVAREPKAADFLRMTKQKEFEEKDWEKLSQLAELANLGKPEKLR